MKKQFMFLFTIALVIISFQFVLGETIITTNYSSSDIHFNYPSVYKTDSVILRITTDDMRGDCLYGIDAYSDPTTSFSWEYGFAHEIHLENLGEGPHTYYIKCGTGPKKDINFATSIPIYATIQMSEEPPLKEGIYTINVITSKASLITPTLKYTFDEWRTYNLISLTGSSTTWEGDLIVPGSAGETICSFEFKSKDLTGVEGTKIIGDNSFVIDTIVPSAIGMINSIGYEGQIKLDWFFEEDFTDFNIYRSENPQVDYTEFYKTTAKKYFYDNDVEKGKTYYYRIAAVDKAKNIGDLSKEVYATALLNNYSGNSGLNPSLIGRVDNSISEINSVISNIEEIKALIELKDEKETAIFKEIKLDKELENSISELNSLKRDVEGYKLQDLSEAELTNKLSSATLKLNIIKKKTPEDITLISEKEKIRLLNEENTQKTFLEYFSGIQDNYNDGVKETLSIINEKNIKITSNSYQIEILYLDGTKKELTLLEETITPKLNEMENLYFILIVPKEIAEKSSELKFMNLEYEIIKDDPIISFKSDTEKIIYYINKELDLNSLEEIIVSPINLPNSEIEKSRITGNSILSSFSESSWGIFVLIGFALLLIIYFLKVKGDSSIKPVLQIMEDIKKSKELLNTGKEEEAKRIYNLAKEEYKNLSDKEKRIIIEGIKKMDEKRG